MFPSKCSFYFFLGFGTVQIIQNCRGLKYIDTETQNEDQREAHSDISLDEYIQEPNPSQETREGRRNWLVSSNLHLITTTKQAETEDEKDEKLKSKIAALVEQTVQDTNKKIQLVSHMKEQLHNQGPYKAGFILSMIKKTKDVLNDLFNVAAKHKDEWKALEQLKVFELIVHTNVDTTNLVRQLVEIHVQNLNSTNKTGTKRRMVLIK